jgi:hypothetical protein
MGLQETHISKPDRRDRLFFVSAICIALLTFEQALHQQTIWKKLLYIT